MEKYIDLKGTPNTRVIFGPQDRYLKMVLEHYNIKCRVQDNAITLEGPEDRVHQTTQVIGEMVQVARKRGKMNANTIRYLLGSAMPARREVKFMKKTPAPLTDGQAMYVRCIEDYPITICTGPAGTGKTFMAAAQAVAALESGEVKRIVLARPAVEAGESLGFLPGNLEDKINPYLRPLFDSISILLSPIKVRKYIEDGVIEVAPLAFMRGRTLRDCFAILDEAQNTTPSQMLMFLTRFGRNAKMVVCGDADQSDLEASRNGLTDAVRKTENLDCVAHIHLDRRDVVRHDVVAHIVEAYNKTD